MNPYYQDDLLHVYHADCRELIATLSDESVDLVMSDPPYGIDFQSNQRVATKKFDKIEGDKQPPVEVLPSLYRVLKPNSACYLFTRWDVQPLWIAELEKAGFEVKNVLVWDKMIHGMGDLEGDWGTEHENIIYAVKGRHILNLPRPTSVIHSQKVPPGNQISPFEKPIGVWYKMIKASSNSGNLVFDPYAGTCSSLLACRQLGRRSLGCEIDIQWLDVSKPRLNQLSMF